MYLLLDNHDFHFEVQNICRLFLPQERIEIVDSVDGRDGIAVITTVEQQAGQTALTVRLRWDDFDRTRCLSLPSDLSDLRDESERRLCELLYYLLVEMLRFEQTWGIVTGVRPVKLLRRLAAEQGEEAAAAFLKERLLVSDRKLQLCRQTLQNENKLLALSRPESYSLYVSVPFCPTRCDYCSFVSQTVTRAAKLIPEYVTLLTQELAHTAALARELGLRLETVYFGGGTPTTLTAEQLHLLTETVAREFDLSHLREYTVEAGRPDTVTREKLQVLKQAGVTRISINPQTLSDEVLQHIGRKHTVAQFYEAFELARKTGHGNINADLIAGLPTDTFDGFSHTLEQLLALSPESVTVHTLSMKRASNLSLQKRADYRVADEAANMVALSAERLPAAGYQPYYLYRQSRTVGNQENVGWAKAGFESLYNVYIMDETHTILGCGAGAVSKLKRPHTDYLERIFNYKFPYEYNTGLGEMLRRKEYIREFYQTT